jgi:ABC-type multidrug transport system ATPase subunit
VNALLVVQGLGFAWPGQPPLFQNLNASFSPGLCLVTGDEQAGKSTLLRLMAAECSPDTGSITLAGRPLKAGWAGWHANMQDPALGACVVADWLRAQMPDDPARDRLEAHLDGLSLNEHLHKTFYMLSAGGRRKVGLAAAMALQAPLTLLDQPFSALDLPSVRCVTEWLREQSRASDRLVLVADYGAPSDLPISQRIDLG